jgi:hypothetical protein
VNWCGVDFDGTLNFGKSLNVRFCEIPGQFRGYGIIGESLKNTNYKPGSSLYKI